MKFSTKTSYGLKAILVLASRFGEGSIPVSHIAKKEGISVPYLEQILNSLKRQGLVKSVRGPQGGYILTKKPFQITLETLFCALEGKNALKSEKSIPITPETDEVAIANFIFWKKFETSLKESLSAVTLKDLLDESRRLKKKKPSPNHSFNI